MPRLNEILGSMDSLQQHRGLLILQEVVKSLASKRLRNDRRVFKVNFVIFPLSISANLISTKSVRFYN